MEQQIDPPLAIASLLVLLVLGSSLVLWIRHIQRPRTTIIEDHTAPAWPIGWVNFGIFVCAMVVFVALIQQAGFTLFFEPPAENDSSLELTPWLAVYGVLTLQLPLLAVFYGARRFYPGLYASRLNNAVLTIGEAFRQALPSFLMLLPLIWIASLIWSNILTFLQAAGAIEEFAPQELVTLFQGGGNPLAIGILVMMAVILAPITEEIIFRGCIYRFLKSQTTLLPAQIISGCLFSLMHANLLSFIPLVLVGVFLARVYEKTGNLVASIWFHALFNAFNLLVLYLTSLSEAIPQ